MNLSVGAGRGGAGGLNGDVGLGQGRGCVGTAGAQGPREGAFLELTLPRGGLSPPAGVPGMQL